MNLSKLGDVNPYQDELSTTIHIVGCGSVGSTQAELLARYGFSKFKLYDFDFVEAKNLCNQMFFTSDLNNNKAESLKNILLSVNPDVEVRVFDKGYTNQRLNGIVILCADNIDLCRDICEQNKLNPYIKVMLNYRTARYNAQHYAVEWSDKSGVDNLIGTMNFSHEEAKAEVPVSACGVEIGESIVVRDIVLKGTTNLFKWITERTLSPLIISAPYEFDTLVM